MRCERTAAGPSGQWRDRIARRDDRGTVTAELAACLPVLVLVLAVALSAVAAASARVRAQDAAREAARAAARRDPAMAERLAADAAPGALVAVVRDGNLVTARVRVTVHPLASWLPALTVAADATALAEP
jgi:Flp pilus assembly protein TadG